MRDELTDGHDEKEEVEEKLELVVEDERQERDHAVLLVADHVGGKLGRGRGRGGRRGRAAPGGGTAAAEPDGAGGELLLAAAPEPTHVARVPEKMRQIYMRSQFKIFSSNKVTRY